MTEQQVSRERFEEICERAEAPKVLCAGMTGQQMREWAEAQDA